MAHSGEKLNFRPPDLLGVVTRALCFDAAACVEHGGRDQPATVLDEREGSATGAAWPAVHHRECANCLIFMSEQRDDLDPAEAERVRRLR